MSFNFGDSWPARKSRGKRSSSAQQSPSFLDDYLPSFVKDALAVESFHLVSRYDKTCVEVELQFIATTNQTKVEFNRIQAAAADGKEISPDLIICDGPCGQEVPDNRIVQFGDCDHTICRDCLKSSLAKTLYDDSPCCCNKICLKNGSWTPMASRRSSLTSDVRRVQNSANGKEKSKKKKQRSGEEKSSKAADSTKSSTKKKRKKEAKKEKRSRPKSQLSQRLARSSSAINQLVVVKVFSFSVGKRKVMRHTVELELLGHSSMAFVMGRALSLMSSEPPGQYKWFYTTKEMFHRRDLIPIEPEALAKMTASQLADNEEILSVLVTGPGTSI